MLKVAKEDLRRSGISTAEAEDAEMYSAEDASSVFDEFKPVPALIIPYIDPWTDDFMVFERGGEELPFHRVRYLTEAPKAQGFKKKKQVRYSQPQRSGVHPYFPIADDIDWVAIAEDVGVPIMITEGEKKSLAACLAGVPTIGLGGVYNFTHDGELLPALDRIDWSQRTVYICYDSDAADNSKIQAAEGRLATELSMKRNAAVFLVRLPELPGGAKMGVDDFLVKKGDDALFELLEKAPEMRKLDREVLRMNAEVAWIDKEGLLLDLRTDTWLRKADFMKGSDFSSRTIVTPNMKGDGVKTISVASAWLTHPHARRYTATIFRPGTTDKAIPLSSGGIAYNRFRGLEGKEGDVKPFFDLYDHMMSRTDEFDHELIWKILAYKVQNFEASIDLGLILLGRQGGGKSLFCKIIAEMVDPYSKVMSSKGMSSEYNGWLENSLVVVIHESKAKKLKENMSTLYTYVTDRRQPINEKYRVSCQVDCYAFFVFNSNERSAGAFPDDDRRMVVLGCPDTHPDGDLFYVPIYQWRKEGGPKKLLHFFQNFDLKGWEPPRHAPDTREKRQAYFASLTPVQKLGHDIRKGSTNLVAKWIMASLDWATSEQVGSTSYQIALAQDIARMMMHIQIRPFYTPDELAMMFPSIAGTLAYGRMREATPANQLVQELVQTGVEYLRCTDNFDGFRYKGQIKQFLIISDQSKYEEPISQQKFDKLMREFPTYEEHRAERRKAVKKRSRKR